MGRIRLLPGTRYLLHDQVFLIRQVLVAGDLLVENQSFGGQQHLPMDDLCAAWARGDLRFEVHGPHTTSASATTLATSYTFADFQQLPERYRDEAWRRYQLIRPLLHWTPEERTRAALDAYVATLRERQATAPPRQHRAALGQALSRASLQRWLHAFLDSGADIRALVPAAARQGGKGYGRLDPALEAIITDVLAECAAQPAYRTGQDVYLLIVNRIAEHHRLHPALAPLALPAPATIYRRIAAAHAPTILRRRVGRLSAQAERAVRPAPDPARILERVEMDHTLLDVFLVDADDRLPIGRPTLTTALDVFSGFPLGCFVGFEPPSYRAVMNCLLHAIVPKADTCELYGTMNQWLAYGLPETLVVDNAPELTGRDLAEACAQLGMLLDPAPVKAPWFKGSIERHFRTNNTGLIHTLPGATFSNVVARGDYDPAQHACLSLRAFWELLHVFLLDVYAQQWHKGINAIPARRWADSFRHAVVPTLPNSAAEVRLLLMRTEERTLQRCGIEFETLVYQGSSLARLRSALPVAQRTVRIKYDPADLGMIYLLDPTPSGRWLSIPAVDQAYAAGLSLWKHRLIRRYVLQEQKTVDIYALAAAKQHIQDIVEREFRLTRKTRTRKTAARFLEIGTGPAPSTGSGTTNTTMSGQRSALPSAPESVVVGQAAAPPLPPPPVPAHGSPPHADSETCVIDTTGFWSDFGLPPSWAR
jgi:putative transposase